jgi:co-chaperonin GroES (HSP10)
MENSRAVDLSYIEDSEVIQAKQIIEEQLGFPVPRVCGYHMAVKIFVRPEETKEILGDDGISRKIYLPHTVTVHDKYRSCTALVLSMGSEAYKGDRFKDSGPWCKVGDWVVIPRNEGVQINYREVPMQIIPDDRVLCIVEDPSHVTRD